MGNCLRKNQVSAQDENEEGERVEQIKAPSYPMLEMAHQGNSLKKKKKKKKVRFNMQDDRGGKGSDGNSSSGAMRIRLVVTKEELKRMLRNKNENDAPHTSLGQLLSDIKLREKTVSKIEEISGSLNSWRPALESIPEDHSMK